MWKAQPRPLSLLLFYFFVRRDVCSRAGAEEEEAGVGAPAVSTSAAAGTMGGFSAAATPQPGPPAGPARRGPACCPALRHSHSPDARRKGTISPKWSLQRRGWRAGSHGSCGHGSPPGGPQTGTLPPARPSQSPPVTMLFQTEQVK